MMRSVERYECIDAGGRLRLVVDDNGNVGVVVIDERGNMAAVEFYAPMTGGGGSPATWKALRALAKAMAVDNDDPLSHGRQGDFVGEELLKGW